MKDQDLLKMIWDLIQSILDAIKAWLAGEDKVEAEG